MRSLKQKAQADRYRNALAITSREAPASSWWAEPKTLQSREAFDARVAKEKARMIGSSFGTLGRRRELSEER